MPRPPWRRSILLFPTNRHHEVRYRPVSSPATLEVCSGASLLSGAFRFFVINTGKTTSLLTLQLFFSLYLSFASHLFALLAAALRLYTEKNNASEPGSIASQANSSVTWTQKQGEKIEKSHKQRIRPHSNCTAACVSAHLTLQHSLSVSPFSCVITVPLFFFLFLSSG
jgi:hypothetical protein